MHVKPPHTKRLDIQGLRAVAVLVVVANHLTGFPRGGFVGVDMFFVISGFVITLGLIREFEATGSISFKDFYFRRVARILPAGFIVILCTIAASYMIFFSERATEIFWDGVWAALFSANWRFASEGTDYWDEAAGVSPLQHYWSLGVEEQFYFVWPLLALLVLWGATRLGFEQTGRRKTLALVLSMAILGSFIWAMNETVTNASWAYFSTISRAWELGLGALLAVLAPYLKGLSRNWQIALLWMGLSGIALSIMLISKSLTFPAPWAALPVLAVSLVIISGIDSKKPHTRVLTNPFLVYTGNISYSLYLWHFPVIVLLAALLGERDATFYFIAVVMMAFLAISSFEFIEVPAQRSLTFWRKNGFNRSRARSRESQKPKRYSYLGLGVAVTAAAVLLPAAITQADPQVIDYGSVEISPSSASDENGPLSALSSEIDLALSADEWPDLSPPLGTVLGEGRPDEVKNGCGDTDLSIPNCVFGTDKQETVVVLGDSTGITLLPTVRAAMEENYNVRGMTKAGCITLDIAFSKDDPGEAADCEAFKDAAIAEINAIRPAMVIMSNTAGSLGSLASGTPMGQSGPEVRDGAVRFLQSIEASGADLVVVAAPPLGKPPSECATQTSRPSDCVYQLPESFHISAKAMEEAADATDSRFIDSRRWFCNDAGYCPAFVGDVLVKRDAVHTTKQYAPFLVPVFLDALEGDQT